MMGTASLSHVRPRRIDLYALPRTFECESSALSLLVRRRSRLCRLARSTFFSRIGKQTRARDLLDAGEITAEEVVALLRCCRGSHDQYRETPHHRLRGVPVHVFKPVHYGIRWYVKVYFIDGTRELEPAIFISVHVSDS